MQELLLERNRPEEIEVKAGDAASYALGYTEYEFERLAFQAAFIRDLTEDVLLRAGLERGMRVLDLGCGVGDVSLLAGELVGPTGAVLGVDRSAEAIAIAERRVTEVGRCHWVRFATAELDRFEPEATRCDHRPLYPDVSAGFFVSPPAVGETPSPRRHLRVPGTGHALSAKHS